MNQFAIPDPFETRRLVLAGLSIDRRRTIEDMIETNDYLKNPTREKFVEIYRMARFGFGLRRPVMKLERTGLKVRTDATSLTLSQIIARRVIASTPEGPKPPPVLTLALEIASTGKPSAPNFQEISSQAIKRADQRLGKKAEQKLEL